MYCIEIPFCRQDLYIKSGGKSETSQACLLKRSVWPPGSSVTFEQTTATVR